jgi:hypothetical protein
MLDDFCCMPTLLEGGTPTRALVQALCILYTILYGFCNVPGSGFGSSILGKDEVHWYMGV